MGMFDTVICNYVLPPVPYSDLFPDLTFTPPQGTHFQTKDLECFMEEYVITEDGSLIRQLYNWVEYTEEEMAALPPAPFQRTGRRVSAGTKTCEFHGRFVMYTTFPIPEHLSHLINNAHAWIDYEVKFTDGKLESIIPFEPNKNWL